MDGKQTPSQNGRIRDGIRHHESYRNKLAADVFMIHGKYVVLGGYREEEAGAGLPATSAISRSKSTSTRRVCLPVVQSLMKHSSSSVHGSIM